MGYEDRRNQKFLNSMTVKFLGGESYLPASMVSRDSLVKWAAGVEFVIYEEEYFVSSLHLSETEEQIEVW